MQTRGDINPTVQGDEGHSNVTYGPIINHTDGLGELNELLGGAGSVHWKVLINGMHLPGPWLKYVEYVLLPPGASCGEHPHDQTEEIYVVVRGSGTMLINGARWGIAAGDVLTVPLGSVHSVAADLGEELRFLPFEMFPGRGADRPAQRIAMRERLREEPRGRSGRSRATVDLGPYFTAPWSHLSLTQLAPGANLADTSPANTVLFLIQGHLKGCVGDRVVDALPGFCAGIPAGMPWQLTADDDTEHAELVSIQLGS